MLQHIQTYDADGDASGTTVSTFIRTMADKSPSNSTAPQPPTPRTAISGVLPQSNLDNRRCWAILTPADVFMSKAARRKFQDAEKVAILKRHLLEKVPVSDLCDEHKLYPNQF